ncbi:MAG: hypothetical protein NZ701_13655, partial [Roseiflexus sp.]|nr:hypothetical protein [Roseiflexus sp.]
GHALSVRYPQMLRFNAPETDPFELSVWLERNAGATPLTFTVELSSSALLFIDSAGISSEPRITLTVDSGSLPQQVRLQPLLSNRNERMVVDVIVRDATGKEVLTKPLTIARETQEGFYWRVFRSRFFGDAGLALAVASAVLGIGWQLLNERRQTRVEQQRERIRELRDLFDRDLMEWALASRALEQEAKKVWEEQVRHELRETLDKQEQQLTNRATQERAKRLLHDAAEYYRNSDIQRCSTALDLVIRAYAAKYTELESLPRQLPDVRTADRQQAETLLRVCGALLHCFSKDAHKEAYEDAYEFVVAVLEMLALQSNNQEVKKCLRLALRAKDAETSADTESGAARLSELASTDPRVRRRLTELLPWTFEWSPILTVPGTVTRTGVVTAWLEANGLKMHPFDTHELRGHQPFLERVTLQEALQEDIIQPKSIAVIGHRFDCHVAAVALYNKLQKSPALNKPMTAMPAMVMPVMVTLSDRDATGRDELLGSLVRATGRIWIRLIANQPGALLWLPDDEQALLAMWLVWLSGSLQALRQQLRRAGLKSGMQEQILLRRFDNLLTGVDSSVPHPEMFLNWLAIRPPEIDYTYMIVIDHISDPHVRPFVELLSEAQDVGFVWKIFTSLTRRRMFEKVHSIALTLSEPELLDLLNVAVASAGGPAQNLIDLVEIEDPALNEEEFLRDTLKHAHGSFERALAICQRALVHHLASRPDQNDPKYRSLNEHDFIAALLGA